LRQLLETLLDKDCTVDAVHAADFELQHVELRVIRLGSYLLAIIHWAPLP
jgi:hypothetical protein